MWNIRIKVIVSGPSITKEWLRATLQELFRQETSKPSQYHHDDPNVIIFAYTNKHNANDGQLWVARLIRDMGEGNDPKVNFNELLLAKAEKASLPHQEPDELEKKYHLSHEQRISIVDEVQSCQDNAMNEADRKFGNDSNTDFVRRSEWEGKQDDACVKKVRKKHHLSQKAYDAIELEYVHERMGR